MEMIYRFSSWWCRLVWRLVNAPEGWGYGPRSEILPGFLHHLARVRQMVLGAILFDVVAWLRDYSFSCLPDGRQLEVTRSEIREAMRRLNCH